MEQINQGVYLVSFDELEKMQGFAKCVDEYRSTCRMTGATPVTVNDLSSYKADALHLKILAVKHGDECVGFCGLFKVFYPHLDDYVMGVESLFIRSTHTGRYWFRLFSAMRTMASRNECKGMILDAPVNSRFNKLLSLKLRPLNTSYWCNVK